VTYVVVDDAGNKASASAKVVVPRHHDHHDGDGCDRDGDHDGRHDDDRDHDGDGRH
jgi:hypothetical protein